MIDVLCLRLYRRQFIDRVKSRYPNPRWLPLLDGVGLITAFAIPAAVCYFLTAHHSSFSDS